MQINKIDCAPGRILSKLNIIPTTKRSIFLFPAFGRMRKRDVSMSFKKAAAIFATLAIVIGAVFVFLVWNGVIILNGAAVGKYQVKGIDVSAYQGEIDWETLAGQNIRFAFIKATEGSSFVDRCFAVNFEQAQKTSLAVGAYHFFSYDSPGETQARNFIDTVKPFEGMLPPVIDLEFYGDKEENPPERDQVDAQLKEMLRILEAHYGQKPIIYATEKSYEMYLAGDYAGYDIWIRNVITSPGLSDGRDWTFWQYTNREKLRGYNGPEKYIDMNVFYGSVHEYEEYLNEVAYRGAN